VADQALQLVVRKGPRPGQVFPLTQEAISIGRDPLSDIVLDDAEVSRQHAQLRRVGEGYQLQDVGSTNGTFVDGQRLTGEAVALKPGQVVMMGSNVTLICQATSESDPFATMVAPSLAQPEAEPEAAEPEPEFETPPPMAVEEMAEAAEEAVHEEPEMATMMEDSMFVDEEVEPDTDAMPAYEEAASFPPEPEPEDATELLPSFEEPAATDSPAESEPSPSFEEPLPPPAFEEPEPVPMPSFEEPEPMPAFEEPGQGFEEPPKIDSGQPMGDFEPEPPPAPPPAPPPPDTGAVKEPDPNRNRNIIIAVVVILLLCCCCLLIAAVVAVANSPGGLDLGNFSALVPAAGGNSIV
jgi:predicted component of type VI protein secretion system